MGQLEEPYALLEGHRVTCILLAADYNIVSDRYKANCETYSKIWKAATRSASESPSPMRSAGQGRLSGASSLKYVETTDCP